MALAKPEVFELMINNIGRLLRAANSPRITLVITVSLLLSGCGGGKLRLSTLPQLIRLETAPQTSSIPLGQTVQFKATGIFSDGSSKDETTSASWASGSGNIASIDAKGFATSHAVGSAAISASFQGLSSSATLTVSKAAIISLAVDPSSSSVALGTAAQLKATGTYTDGSRQDLTSTVTWANSEPDIATVSPAGLVVSKAIGKASITATAGSANASCQFTVLQATLASISIGQDHSTVSLGSTTQFKAQGVYTDGSARDLTNSVSWSTSPQGIVALSSSGLATGLKIGTVTVNAASGAVAATGRLTVSGAELTSIAVTSAKATFPLGTTQQMGAQGTYTDGSTRDLTSSVSWSSSPQGVAAVNASGLATGLKAGTATINATSGSVTGKRQLTVSAAVLASISVTSAQDPLPLGTTQQMTANGNFTDGSTRDLTNSVTWSSSSNQIVSISNKGVAGAKAMGTTIVSATASTISGSVPLTVSAPVLASISISPGNSTIPLQSSLQLAAVGSFTDGSTQDLTNSTTWSADDTAIVNLSSMGSATALQVGSTSVRASLYDIQGSTTLVVEPVAATSYFSTGPSQVDTTFRFSNPGSDEPQLCAMAYVFDQDQQMAECCGCLISHNGLRTLSLNRDLIANPLTGTAPTTGTLMLVTADSVSNPSCNAASITPRGMAIAWATHLQTPSPSVSAVSESTLSSTPLSATLSSSLQAQCQFIQQLGGGQGICTCGAGD